MITATETPARKPLQFSLRGILITVTLVAVLATMTRQFGAELFLAVGFGVLAVVLRRVSRPSFSKRRSSN